MRPVAITCGDPAGIGPDIILQYFAANRFRDGISTVVLGDPDLFRSRARQLGIDITITVADGGENTGNGMAVIPVRLQEPVRAGQPDPGHAPYILACLDAAIDGCQTGRFSALVTAPVSKAVINRSGVPFTGHTEYIADRLDVPLPVMMLATMAFRVVLVTTHLPLREVPDAITRERVEACLRILVRSLETDFGIADPCIRVSGLNPHAGDGGYLGEEDATQILPAIQALNAMGARVEGPFPADTMFSRQAIQSTDAFLAMFHDQGLPVLKYAGFGEAINITLGLPIIRTSVDHGTAFELAGTGRASEKSLAMAIEQAGILASNRRAHAH